MKRKVLFIILLCECLLGQIAVAQQANLAKLSPMLRRWVYEERTESRKLGLAKNIVRKRMEGKLATVFVKTNTDGRDMLQQAGCEVLASWGNLYIVSASLGRLTSLSLMPQVERIEANRSMTCTMDSAIVQVNAVPVYEGEQLPQAFTGKGVVMGVMDVGFDLTHPNFYDSRMTNYRIKAFWDQLSTDTLESRLPVGRDYVGKDALLALGCSRDGRLLTHGTHTLGIAAGSGGEGVPLDTLGRYHGMAYESDICLVANATSNNRELVDSAQVYKFTYATDVLGFKYIFDYADRVGKPCVISFSEGSVQDFQGNDVLFYAALDSLTSKPGHVIVASAGNDGEHICYIEKPMGRNGAGCFVSSNLPYAYQVAKSDGPVAFRTTIYQGKVQPTYICVNSEEIFSSPDSTWVDTVSVAGNRYVVTLGAYPSCYNPSEICYDWMVTALDEGALGMLNRVSCELLGTDANAALYRGVGTFFHSSANPLLSDGDNRYGVFSPGSAPSVICVGNTINRNQFVNVDGERYDLEGHTVGDLDEHSSVGPTLDGRVKPDVVAPGTLVVSSYSSFYEQEHPDASDIRNDAVARFSYDGRNYSWVNSSGTSMATPVVGGAIALWLEANPLLTTQDVLNIIRKTSVPLDASISIPNNQWGYGRIDVYRGLLAALQLDGISQISSCQPRKARVSVVDGGKLQVCLDARASSAFSLNIYSTSGVRLRSESMPSGQTVYQVDVSELPRGVYAVQLVGTKEITGSSLVRK